MCKLKYRSRYATKDALGVPKLQGVYCNSLAQKELRQIKGEELLAQVVRSDVRSAALNLNLYYRFGPGVRTPGPYQ